MLVLAGFLVLDGLIGWRLPTGFLPEEDYGYAFLNVQLPPAASLERTEQVLKKIEQMLHQTEGVQAYNTIGGFSLLTRTSASYQGFFFIGLKPWHERTSDRLEAKSIVATINGGLSAKLPEAIAVAFMPPSIPGLGSAGGFSFWLQDRSGGSADFLAENLQKFS
jgi:HAE1 family hydrophobic/amphiphilic exporter-1